MKLPEHRAAARIAWRQARRARGRTALVITLIALPVLGLSAAGFMIKTAMSTPEEQATAVVGGADMLVDGELDLTTADIQRVAPPGSTVVAYRQLYSTRLSRGTLSFYNVYEYSVPPDRQPVSPLFVFRRGRAPQAAGEAAAHPEILRDFRVRLGQTLFLEDLNLTLRIVGEVLRREQTGDELIVAGPGTYGQRPDIDQKGWFVDTPPAVTEEDRFEAMQREPRIYNVMTRESMIDIRRNDQLVVTGTSFGITGIGLFCTGLIAAAAIGVGARRQLRTLGLVGATGGEPRHVRSIVVWSGAVVGLVGSLVGAGLAVITAYAAAPHLDGLVGRIVGEVRIPFWILAGGILLGTIAAAIAAIGPARYAARLQTVESLAGRTPPPKPPGSLARRGLLAVVGGSVLLGIATASREDKLLMIALVPTLGGFLLAIPLLVTWIGRASSKLPMALRLAARQTARYGRRTGTAMAAATLALAFPISIATFTRSDEALYNQRRQLAPNQMILGVFVTNPNRGGVQTALSPEMLAAAADAVPGSIAVPIRAAVTPIPAFLQRAKPGAIGEEDFPIQVEGPTRTTENAVEYFGGGSLAIGDATLLRALNAEAAIPLMESGKIIAINSEVDGGELRLRYPPESPDDQGRVIDVPAVQFGPAKTTEGVFPHYVISEAGARRYGLRAGAAMDAVLRAPRPLTPELAESVKRAVSTYPGGHAEWIGDFRADGTIERLMVTGIAVAIALVIVAVAVALVGAESRREHAILVAVGAEPGTRRKMVAANAFMISALAGVLGAASGFTPIAVMLFARREGHPLVLPWQEMGLVALGAPLIAGLVAAIASREPRSLLRATW